MLQPSKCPRDGANAREAQGASVPSQYGARVDISFIVAARDVAPFVADAVRSALEQCDVAVEVVVVDDGSVDETAPIVAGLSRSDERVRLIALPASSGPSAARNTAIAAAKGEWIAILDADDFIHRDRSRRLIDLGLATDAKIVADNFVRVDLHGNSLGSTMIPEGDHPYVACIDLASFMDGNLALSASPFPLGAIKPLVRRDFVVSNDLYYRTDLDCGEDFEFLAACIATEGKFLVTSQVGYSYRVRPGSQSWRLSTQQVERLLDVHRQARLEEAFRGEARTLAAANRYGQALERAQRFLGVVGAVKSGRFGNALWRSFCDPHLWPMLVRFGSQAAGRRLRLVP